MTASAATGGPSHEVPAEHRRGVVPERYFRWRSGVITRLEAFRDVVFGFPITLLVVSLEVPQTYGADLARALQVFPPFRPGGLLHRFPRPRSAVSDFVLRLSAQVCFYARVSSVGQRHWARSRRERGLALVRIYPAGFMAFFTFSPLFC